jgi:hypothetical protein
MSNHVFPAALKPIVSKGYSYSRGSNVFRSEVTGGLPRQGRDTYFEPVPFNVTLVVSALGNQTFQSFLTKISGGADSFVMALDSGLGIKDHQCLITSAVNIDTSDGINWNIAFTLMAERTDIQEETCLTANLPDLFGCYGDGLNCFLDSYATAQTTFPRIWSDEGPAGYPPINMQALALDSRVVYSGPQISYLNSAGLLATSAANEWPLTFVGGVAVGRVAPEPAAFNGLKYNSDLSQSLWSKVSVSVGAAGVAPDGGVSYGVVPSAASGIHEIAQAESSTLTTGDTFTTSVFIKPAGSSLMQLRWFAGATGNSAAYQNFDAVSMQTAGTALSYNMTSVGSGWVRVSATVLFTGTGVGRDVGVGVIQSLTQGRRPTWTGDGVNGVSIWGVQVEKGGFASSPIPTTTALVTRPAATAKVTMSGAMSIDVTYSDGSVVNSPAVGGYATIPQADTAWGSKYITRIDFNV